MNMIRKLTTIAAAIAISNAAFAQSNPTAQSLPYTNDFSALAASSTTYPAGWQGWTISTSPGGTFNTAGPTADRTLTASSTAATTSGNVHNYNSKIGYLNTSSLDLTLGFAINTTGLQNIKVFYDVMTIRNPYDGSSNTRINEVALQYRVGTSGSWTTIAGTEYQNNTTTQTTAVTTPQNTVAIVATLPNDCKNQAVVQLRWASRQVSGGGSRPSFAVDNLGVEGSIIPPDPPVATGIAPTSISTNFGGSASFTVSYTGSTPSYFWYKISGGTTNPISSATTATLTLTNVSGADAAYYQVVLTNSYGSSTSEVVSLTVTDPYLTSQPANQTGILGGQVQFYGNVLGSGLSHQWYFCADANDNTQITTAVPNGTLASGAIASGANTSTLNITNLQSTDPTNFVLVVTGTYGSVTSSVVSLSLSTTAVPLAFWTFNGPLDATNPATYQGIGLASPTNVSPFLSSANYSASDSYPGTPNNGWGSRAYPAQGTSNKLAGAQFAASTVGAKNVKLSFDLRATAGASKYFRLQYTTNGTVYADCPASSTIGTSANNWWSYNYDLTGYPGAQNNPNFGVRVVAEFESTAKYGNTNNANYVAVSGSYNNDPTFGGTYTFDVVKITGDAITDANQPPTIGTVTNISFTDTVGGTLNFTVNDDGGAGALNVSAVSLDPSVSLTLNAVNTGGNVALSINSSLNNGLNVNVPVLITVTDGNGNSTVAWFTATVVPNNTVPTLTGLSNTNMLTNSVLVIPFKVVDNAPAGVTVTADAAYNSVLLPNGSVVVSGTGTNRTLTITPAAGQSGTAAIKLTADDTTYSSVTTIFLTVRPRNSVLLVDNFDWANGPLITNSAFFWQHHGGNTFGELQVADGRIIVDNVANFEDVNAPLIGAPIMTNTPTVLYAKLEINCSVAPPNSAGSYFAHFKDDANGFFCRLFISSNTPSSYWVGIGNSSGSSSTTARLSQALNVGETYTVVCRMVVSNTVCTVWVNPASEADTSATANDAVSNRNNVYAYAFRENSPAGIINVSNVVVATSFSAATGLPPSLSIRPDSGKAILSWTDADYGLQAASAVTGTYTNVPGATSPFTNAVDEAAKFYRLVK